MPNRQKVGVFSGTFDPFHIAHLEACLVSMAACELDSVVIITERKPRFKHDVTSHKIRVHMIDLATSDYPRLRQLDVSDDQLTTANTLPILREQFAEAELWYVVGSDLLEHMLEWEKVGDLFDNFNLCVILRHNKSKKIAEASLSLLKDKFPTLNYKILPEVWSPVSSSVIRNQVKKTGYSPYLHRDVMKYIVKNSIY